MAKRVANLLDANLPVPPRVPEFLEVLQKYKANLRAPAKKDPVHGDMLNKTRKLCGSENAERAAVNSALNFVALCTHLQAVYEDLDDWFVAWGAWIIDEELLCDLAEDVAAMRARRKEQAGGKFKVKHHPVGSFRTYLNAVARVYTQTVPEVILVPSSKRQFPKLTRLLKEPIRKERLWKTVRKSRAVDAAVLSEAELPMIRETVDFDNALQVQRWTLLLLGFRSGLRAETLRSMVSAAIRFEGQGPERKATFMIGNMKNLPADMDHVDRALFQQVLVAGPDAKYCALEALALQFALLEKAKEAGRDAQWLFRTVWTYGATLTAQQCGEDTTRGVADWVSKIVGRRLTWKDVARRAAMTRLANDPSVSADDIAKYFGVTRTTVAVYHQASEVLPYS